MRICLYSENAIPVLGGQALVVDALARELTAAGHQVVVLAPRQRHTDTSADAPVPYRLVRHPRIFSTRWFIRWYGHWLARLHRRERFDLVHAHSTYPNGYVAACCGATAGVPLVITSHGSDLDPLSLLRRKPQLRPRYLRALHRADAVIAVSGFIEKQFRELAPELRRIERIPNGVDLARFAAAVPRPARLPPAIRSGEYVLFIGRLERRKGVDLLLEAFAAAAADHRARLVIAGEGAQQSALRVQAAALGLQGRVDFVGRAEGDVKTWLLRHAQCSVIPSRVSEAFPLTLLESFAAGRPVIGTEIPGLEELIAPGRTGWLVPPESVPELAGAIRRVVCDPQSGDAQGRQAQQFAQAFDWRQIAERHLELFEELVAQRSARQAA